MNHMINVCWFCNSSQILTMLLFLRSSSHSPTPSSFLYHQRLHHSTTYQRERAYHTNKRRGTRHWKRMTGRGGTGTRVAMPQVCLLYILSILYTDIYSHLVRLRTRLLTKWHAPHLRTPWRVVRSPTWYPTTRRKVCMTTTHQKRGSRRVSSSGMYFCSLFLLTKLPHHHQQLTSPQHVQRRRRGPKTR